jgi:hypothetical protein
MTRIAEMYAKEFIEMPVGHYDYSEAPGYESQ